MPSKARGKQQLGSVEKGGERESACGCGSLGEKNAAQCERLPEISGSAPSPKETAHAALRPGLQR